MNYVAVSVLYCSMNVDMQHITKCM